MNENGEDHDCDNNGDKSVMIVLMLMTTVTITTMLGYFRNSQSNYKHLNHGNFSSAIAIIALLR